MKLYKPPIIPYEPPEDTNGMCMAEAPAGGLPRLGRHALVSVRARPRSGGSDYRVLRLTTKRRRLHQYSLGPVSPY